MAHVGECSMGELKRSALDHFSVLGLAGDLLQGEASHGGIRDISEGATAVE